jgi:hypothetical protein
MEAGLLGEFKRWADFAAASSKPVKPPRPYRGIGKIFSSLHMKVAAFRLPCLASAFQSNGTRFAL